MKPEAPQDSDVLYEKRGAVAILTLNREKKLNALRRKTIQELSDLLETIADDQDVRAVVLTGKGRAFCAGADLALMQSCFGTLEGPDVMLDLVRRMQRLFARIESAPVLTLAEIGGAAALRPALGARRDRTCHGDDGQKYGKSAFASL